jgi:hypothetical protein
VTSSVTKKKGASASKETEIGENDITIPAKLKDVIEDSDDEVQMEFNESN